MTVRDATATEVVVIGARMAGVSAARALAQGGIHVVVVEETGAVGGRIRTDRAFAPAPVEVGAEFIHVVGAATWPDAPTGLRVPRPRGSTLKAAIHRDRIDGENTDMVRGGSCSARG